MQAQTALGSLRRARTGRTRTGWPAFADRLLELAREAEPGFGSPAGVTSTRCARRCCRRGTSRCWRRCSTPTRAEHGLPGLVVDTDLRWRIVTALAAARRDRRRRHARRRSSTPRPQRDPTAAGKRNARGARRPRARRRRSRRQAWQQVVEDDTCRTSPRARSSAASCSRVRPSCSQPFTSTGTSTPSPGCGSGVQRGRADRRHRPVPVVGHQPGRSLDAADEFLAGELPPALRRLVLEGRAGVERALRARAFDVTLARIPHSVHVAATRRQKPQFAHATFRLECA